MAKSKAGKTMMQAAGIVGSGGLGLLVKDYGIGGLFYAIFEVLIGLVYSLGDTILAPFLALYGGVATFVEQTILSGLQIIDAGGATSAEAVTSWGILGYAAGIAAFLAGLVLVVALLRRSEWRPWNVITGRR
jgi:hypothetical protein